MFQVIHSPYKKITLACIACLCFETGECPWPDLSALFQYTSPTPVVSLHLIPRFQYHPGIPVTLFTGSSFKKDCSLPVYDSQAWVWPIIYCYYFVRRWHNVVQTLWTQSSRCSGNVSNGESETMRLGQGKPKGTLWGPSLGMKKTLVSSLLWSLIGHLSQAPLGRSL